MQRFTKADVKEWRDRDLNCFGWTWSAALPGHPDVTRKCLDNGSQWLEAQLLCREAERLIDPKSKEKPDKK